MKFKMLMISLRMMKIIKKSMERKSKVKMNLLKIKNIIKVKIMKIQNQKIVTNQKINQINKIQMQVGLCFMICLELHRMYHRRKSKKHTRSWHFRSIQTRIQTVNQQSKVFRNYRKHIKFCQIQKKERDMISGVTMEQIHLIQRNG